jgi:hypothetical protein
MPERARLGHNKLRALAAEFDDNWRGAVERIIAAGKVLVRAKAELKHGQWSGWVKDYLRISLSTADALRRIAEHPLLSKSEFVQNLPPSWGTLFELTKLPHEALWEMLRDGTIHPELTRAEVINRASQPEPYATLAERFGVPPFSVIEIDNHPEFDLSPAALTCELAYHWFCPPEGLVLDPFPADGSVRGVVASKLGRKYVGIDLSERRQLEAITQEPPRFDFIFTCPPYWNLDPARVSLMVRDDFFRAYGEIIAAAVGRLRNDRFACCVLEDVRDADGFLVNLPQRTAELFGRAGARLYNEVCLVYRRNGAFRYLLVFCKGSPRRAVASLDSSPPAMAEGSIPGRPIPISQPALRRGTTSPPATGPEQ